MTPENGWREPPDGVREPRGNADSGRARPDLSVVVVVTPAPRPLDGLYEQYGSAFRDLGETFEFIFVGEPWARPELQCLLPLAEAGHPIRVFEAGWRTGESNLLLAAREHCRGDLLVILPSYERIEPGEIGKLIERVQTDADLASAARGQEGDHWLNRLSHGGFHFLLRHFVGAGFRDVASGVRVLRPEVLDEVPLYGDALRFLPFLAEREAFRVEEVEVRQHGHDRRAKLYSPGTYVRRLFDLVGLAFLTRFGHKPLRFFGLIGGALVLIGGVALAVLVVQRFTGTALGNRPALVGAVLLTVLGVQAIALGLIGEIIVHFSVENRPAYRLERLSPADTESLPASGVRRSEGEAESSDLERVDEPEPAARRRA